MINIRKAVINDLVKIKKIDALAFKNDSYPIFVLRQYFDISGDYLLVAEENNEIIGYTIGNLIAKTSQGWILSLGVHPKSRGKKIGGSLTKKLLTLLEKNNSKEVFLTVHPQNKSAIRIYQELGFEEVGKSDNYYFDEEKRIIMKKKATGKELKNKTQ